MVTLHIAMIRTPDRKSPPSPVLCYEEAAQPAFGIAFERLDGLKRFVPYAFLSALDFDGPGELAFRFTSASITVFGTDLEPIWEASCNGILACVRESKHQPKGEKVWVREIIFTDPESNVPTFPREL